LRNRKLALLSRSIPQTLWNRDLARASKEIKSDKPRVLIMKRFTSPLRNVKVASPCPADWDRMIGDERARFCGQCELNVYNLSTMSTLEAESLIARTEGRLCVRYYRRKDGSIITQDCPVGLLRLKQRAARIKRAAASLVLGFLAGLGFHGAANRFGVLLLNPTSGWGGHGATMGVMAAPKPQPPALVLGRLEERRTIARSDTTERRPRS
jgi:hypothetical protein